MDSFDAFKIVKLSDGGFLVSPVRDYDDGIGGRSIARFACSKIGDALEYIRERLTEERATPGGRL